MEQLGIALGNLFNGVSDTLSGIGNIIGNVIDFITGAMNFIVKSIQLLPNEILIFLTPVLAILSIAFIYRFLK